MGRVSGLQSQGTQGAPGAAAWGRLKEWVHACVSVPACEGGCVLQGAGMESSERWLASVAMRAHASARVFACARMGPHAPACTRIMSQECAAVSAERWQQSAISNPCRMGSHGLAWARMGPHAPLLCMLTPACARMRPRRPTTCATRPPTHQAQTDTLRSTWVRPPRPCSDLIQWRSSSISDMVAMGTWGCVGGRGGLSAV